MKNPNYPHDYCSEYNGGNIVLERRNGYAFVNVPHAIVKHSPSGFEWGYAGSGPAEAALNILFAVTKNKETAEKYHQFFKMDFLIDMPEEGGIIKKEDILTWLEKKKMEIDVLS